MGMSDDILLAAAADIQTLESFYTSLMRSELTKIADEFMDNPKERKATNEVLDSIHAVISIDPPSIRLSYECKHEAWLTIMNEGMEPPDVTGGLINNPDGTQSKSKAAVTGSKYVEGAEPATYAFDNCMKIANSTFKNDVQAIIQNCSAVKETVKQYLANEIQSALGGGQQ